MTFKILLVDDTRSVHLFVKGLLAHAKDVRITTVNNGQEAVQLLQSNRDFDAILLDWEMPVLDGPSAFEKFKLMGVRVPTLMMTTKNAAADIEQMVHAGISEYVMKPFTADILLAKLEAVTGKEIPNAG